MDYSYAHLELTGGGSLTACIGSIELNIQRFMKSIETSTREI